MILNDFVLEIYERRTSLKGLPRNRAGLMRQVKTIRAWALARGNTVFLMFNPQRNGWRKSSLCMQMLSCNKSIWPCNAFDWQQRHIARILPSNIALCLCSQSNVLRGQVDWLQGNICTPRELCVGSP